MADAERNTHPLPAQPPEPNPPTATRIRKGDAVISLQEMAECLLWDFSKRAQQDEDRAYQQYRRFIDASEKVSDERIDQRLRAAEKENL